MGALMGASINAALRQQEKPYNRPGVRRRFPLWWLAPPPCPVGSVSLDSQSPTAPCESSSLATRWEACHWIRGSRGSPMNPVPLPPPQFGGAAKGKRLNGQARRLTSPHLEVLCRTSTGDYKAPLCCERLMKGMFRGVLFCPLNRGGKGTRFVREQSNLKIV